MAIHVVGGVYREYCVHPHWNDIYGSAGRGALAIANMGTDVVLHSYMDDVAADVINQKGIWLSNFQVRRSDIGGGAEFRYLHDLAVPEIRGLPSAAYAPLTVSEEKVVRYGMLDGDAVVHAGWAVYDPQNADRSEPFHANGSTATHLALILNAWEARQMSKLSDAPMDDVAAALGAAHQAEVVVIKMGPLGALVWTRVQTARVPAFKTEHVWKIGSGDCFVAHFGNAWMNDGLSPADAAEAASKATAYYCETLGLPTRQALAAYTFTPIKPSQHHLDGKTRQVYLAGPFFDLAQVWMVEEARKTLLEMGLKVFSPFHDVGLGDAQDVVGKDLDAITRSDLVLALTDGLDPGTVYEIGYARALNKPVIVYSERHKDESLKMMEGSGCRIRRNYTSAIYTTLWESVEL